MHLFGGLSNQATDAWLAGANLVARAGQCIPTGHLFYRQDWLAVSAALGLQGRAAVGGSRCQTGKGCSSERVNSEHTCSTFLLPFTLYRWTESVTCTGSSLFAVGYAYSERHREYSALLPIRLRQTDLNPRQECQ